MSRRPARFTQAELDRMARTFRETGVAIEIIHDGATMRIIPHLPSPDVARNALLGRNDLDRELEAFEARHGKG